MKRFQFRLVHLLWLVAASAVVVRFPFVSAMLAGILIYLLLWVILVLCPTALMFFASSRTADAMLRRKMPAVFAGVVMGVTILFSLAWLFTIVHVLYGVFG